MFIFIFAIVFFGLIGLIIAGACSCGDKKGTIKCPVCEEYIMKDAVVCKHCHAVIADYKKENLNEQA